MPGKLPSTCRALIALTAIALLPGIPSQAAEAPAARANAAPQAQNKFVAENDVTWTTLGKDENDSMPIGNGDLAANVWTEANGDIVVLLAKSDAWTETGKLVKIGRVRISLSPNPFAGAADFTQTLMIEDATVALKAGENEVGIFADANRPAIRVYGNFDKPTTMQATAEFWRPTQSARADWPGAPDPKSMSGAAPPPAAPDVLFPAKDGRIAWCHFNPASIIPWMLKEQHLEATIGAHPDRLLHRCFGALLAGEALAAADDHTLRSESPSKAARLDIIALTRKDCPSPAAWLAAIEAERASQGKETVYSALVRTKAAWQQVWDRSWIHLAGDQRASEVSQGFALQRYMLACSSRGEMPPKFNGGLFTVGRDMDPTSPTGRQTSASHDPDWRAWGDPYWNQNNRLLFWPLIATGDLDLIQPWFNMYLDVLPTATDRTRTYYHHAGANFPETMYFFGLPRDFGTDNPSFEIPSRWQRYHIQGAIEVAVQMLDVYDQTQDADFARDEIVPLADAVATFYDQHYPRNAAGALTMVPAQSLETYQLVAVNPTPDIAGLMNMLPRLIALPEGISTPAQREAWAKLLKVLPPIPTGTTANGKTPPLGRGDADGTPVILPAEQYGKTGNSENPELYVAFPYRLYGVGKPNLKLAQDTFAARRSPADTCWGQDGPQSAVLGLTSVAEKAAIDYFSNYGDQRFRWFWKPAHDWIPDFDNGGDGMLTIELMLMQCDGMRIQLLPAWPVGWTADFKLHAPYQTVVEGHAENGKISGLKVTPESRAKDVVILPAN